MFLVIYRYKKTKFLRIFGNFRELLKNFRHFQKNLRALFWEIPERILDIFFGNYVAKPRNVRVKQVSMLSL